MWLFDALGPAATVAQLVGVDAAGLIAATLNAVRTVRRNRRECRSLARRVMMVGDLLHLVGSSETMRRPEVRRALDGLGDALRRAFELVESCQERGAAYRFVMAGRQAEQFRDVQSEIDSYLLVFPMVSHIDITNRLDRIYNMLLPPDHPQQALEVVPGSSTSHVGPYTRNEGSDLGILPLESSLTEISEIEELQTTGHQETLEVHLDAGLKQRIVIKVVQQRIVIKALCLVARMRGVKALEIAGDAKDQVVVVGHNIDSIKLTSLLRKKLGHAQLLQVADASKMEEDKQVAAASVINEQQQVIVVFSSAKWFITRCFSD